MLCRLQSVAEEGLNVKAMSIAVMLDGVTSGRARDQCKGRVMRTAGGQFHIFYFDGESGSVWRSQQQSEAMKGALDELASAPAGQAFADIAIGPNPLVKLNSLQGKGIVRGLTCEVSDIARLGMFDATASLTTKQGRVMRGIGSATTKKLAKIAAAEQLLETFMAASEE